MVPTDKQHTGYLENKDLYQKLLKQFHSPTCPSHEKTFKFKQKNLYFFV